MTVANRGTFLNFLILGFEKPLHFDTSVTSGNAHSTTSVESSSNTSVKIKRFGAQGSLHTWASSTRGSRVDRT